MNKLKAVIQFECMTSFKYIWIFYGIQYAVVLLATLIVRVSVDNAEYIGVSGLETNTFIYVGILGMLGYSEDFKMLIQNGFTRRYIFIWLYIRMHGSGRYSSGKCAALCSARIPVYIRRFIRI